MSKAYLFDRILHWSAALFLLFMLMNLSTQLHNVDWDVKGQLEHRQSAVEIHATIGIILLVVTLFRIAYPKLVQADIPRIVPRSSKHKIFISVTHIAMYTCIIALVGTGLAMFARYEIPLSLFGIDFEPAKEAFYREFPKIHQIHMQLRTAIWWLIGIHFVGILAARR